MGLTRDLREGAVGRDPVAEKNSMLVRLLFHTLHPHTVALLEPTKRSDELRIEAIHSREEEILGEGDTVPFSGSILGKAWNEKGGMWLREVSPWIRNVLPIYRSCSGIRSIRLIPFRLPKHEKRLLVIDDLDPPEVDPYNRIEPILRLFAETILSNPCPVQLRDIARKIPLQIFCRRILKPFVDSIPDFAILRSVRLVLWEGRAAGGEILEVIGSAHHNPNDAKPLQFRIGSLAFRCMAGSHRGMPRANRDLGDERSRYFSIRLGEEIVGNLSLDIDSILLDTGEIDARIPLISWSLEREMDLIDKFRDTRDHVVTHNPYQAIIRIFDEWSNASRYNEYLSFGFIHLQFDGSVSSHEAWSENGHFHVTIRNEIERALRKGDVLLPGFGGDIAVIFPRTSPEGAGSALQRLRNLLEGKAILSNGERIRVRSADYCVLSYPSDLPTEDDLLERCCHPILPR
jgi:hypothetical protein